MIIIISTLQKRKMMLKDLYLYMMEMMEQNSNLGFSDSRLHALNYGTVYTGNCHTAAMKESKCLGEEPARGELWHVAGSVSCRFSPDASHSHLAESEEAGTGV